MQEWAKKELYALAWGAVRPDPKMWERASAILAWEIPAEEKNEAKQYFEKVLADHAAAEETWTHRTMNDRIDAAFDALAAKGIVALQWAGDTQSAGWEDSYEKRKKSDRGAVFFTGQDAVDAMHGSDLYLAYGVFQDSGERSEKADGEIGSDVCDALRQEGVEVNWDGPGSGRILIPNFEWQKRRKTEAAKR